MGSNTQSKLASWKMWIILILVLAFLNPAITAILVFLGVDKSDFESYLIWGNGLILFWFILNNERSNSLLDRSNSYS
jgi:hypothetical protein